MTSPPSYPVHKIALKANEDSKIANVDLYTGGAEVSRVCGIRLESGQNTVVLSGLPRDISSGSVKVEFLDTAGAVVQDIVVFQEKMPSSMKTTTTTSPKIQELQDRRRRANGERQRCWTALETLRRGLNAEKILHEDPGRLSAAIREVEQTSESYDERCDRALHEIEQINDAIEEERGRLGQALDRWRETAMGVKATVFAPKEEDAQLFVKYAVVNVARWTPCYEIHASTKAPGDTSVKLVCKAEVHQESGEDWIDAPITLHSAPLLLHTRPPTRPLQLFTDNTGPPPVVLSPLPMIPTSNPPSAGGSYTRNYPDSERMTLRSTTSSISRSSFSQLENSTMHFVSPSRSTSATSLHEELKIPFRCGYYYTPTEGGGDAYVTSPGYVNTTYKLPRPISVLSDAEHEATQVVTIATLTLDSELCYTATPAFGPAVYVDAKISNESEYVLYGGWADVYLDGSMAGRAVVPYTLQRGSFSCALGVDYTISVKHHVLLTTMALRGFFSKKALATTAHKYIIQNTKPVPVRNLKIQSCAPRSLDPRVKVKLASPPLDDTPWRTKTRVSPVSKPLASEASVQISPGVVARWSSVPNYDGGEEEDEEALGDDGRFEWVVRELEPGQRMELVAQWEVSADAKLMTRGGIFVTTV